MCTEANKIDLLKVTSSVRLYLWDVFAVKSSKFIKSQNTVKLIKPVI